MPGLPQGRFEDVPSIVSARTKAIIFAIIIGLVAGVGYPLVDLALACRVPTSEACVWGKAYLSLSLGISIPLIGGLVGAAAYGAWAWRNARGREDDA